MSIEQLIFYILAAVTLGSAFFVVASQNLIRSIFLFFVTLFSAAGLFVFALADFVAVTQIIIYVGGVLVLMLFAFLLSNKDLLDALKTVKIPFISIHHIPGLLTAILFLAMLVWLIVQADVSSLSWIENAGENTLQPGDNTIHHIGINMMTKYLLPFEIISVLLMMALIGAAHLARKEKS